MPGSGYSSDVPDVPSLSQVLELLEERADPATAEEWDRVGLVCGDPQHPVATVRFAVDATPTVVDEAIAAQVDLLVTHHPLLLRGVHSIATTSSRGRSLTQLVRADCALFTMHTNVDQAAGGVSDVLADAIGMHPRDRRPIRPLSSDATKRLVVYAPESAADDLVAALAAAGAGQLGAYDSCAYWTDGVGQFRPLPGAEPHIGSVNEVTQVAERRIEMIIPEGRLSGAVAALRSAHPYEEPAFSIVDSVALPTATGVGRFGPVETTTVGDLAVRIAESLPANAAGVRVAGNPDRPVHTAAVCGGAGDSLLADVAALGVDAYVTSDLRHHPALDFVCDSDVALIDIPHASGESLWLRQWADQLARDARDRGWTLATTTHPTTTDPWTMHVATPTEGPR